MPNINFEDRLLERGKQVLTEAIEEVEITPLSSGSSPSGSLTIIDTDNQHKGLKLKLSIPRGETGAQGPQGPQGPQGKSFTYNDFTPTQLENLKIKGDKGEPGVDGYSPQIAVESEIEILAPEATAYVEDLNNDLRDVLLKFHIPRGTRGLTGRGSRLVIDAINTLEAGNDITYTTTQEYDSIQNLNVTHLTLGIPKGGIGEQGEKGDKGDIGIGSKIIVSDVVSLPPGSTPTYNTTYTYDENQNLNITNLTLGIPSGETGPQGKQGSVPVVNISTIYDLIN